MAKGSASPSVGNQGFADFVFQFTLPIWSVGFRRPWPAHPPGKPFCLAIHMGTETWTQPLGSRAKICVSRRGNHSAAVRGNLKLRGLVSSPSANSCLISALKMKQACRSLVTASTAMPLRSERGISSRSDTAPFARSRSAIFRCCQVMISLSSHPTRRLDNLTGLGKAPAAISSSRRVCARPVNCGKSRD